MKFGEKKFLNIIVVTMVTQGLPSSFPRFPFAYFHNIGQTSELTDLIFDI